MFQCIFMLSSHMAYLSELWMWFSKAWARGWGGGRRRQRPDPSRHCSRLGETQLSCFGGWRTHIKARRGGRLGTSRWSLVELQPGNLIPLKKLDFWGCQVHIKSLAQVTFHQTLSANPLPKIFLKGKPNTSVKYMSGFSFNLNISQIFFQCCQIREETLFPLCPNRDPGTLRESWRWHQRGGQALW